MEQTESRDIVRVDRNGRRDQEDLVIVVDRSAATQNGAILAANRAFQAVIRSAVSMTPTLGGHSCNVMPPCDP